jgi:hypothetical protein
MARAIYVNLRYIYPQLTPAAQVDQQSTALRDCTCGWWRVNPESAGDIRFAFGVYGGRVVSAYSVEIPVTQWPVMPKRAVGQGRRYIPVVDVSAEDWALARTWSPIPMSGPVRYGEVLQEEGGALSGFTFQERPASPEEMEAMTKPGCGRLRTRGSRHVPCSIGPLPRTPARHAARAPAGGRHAAESGRA